MGRAGLVSIVQNATTGVYDCYWYCGAHDDRLVDQIAMSSSAAAIRWGDDRTGRIRIRAGGNTRWAGSAPAPDNVPRLWDTVAAVASAAHPETGEVTPAVAGDVT